MSNGDAKIITRYIVRWSDTRTQRGKTLERRFKTLEDAQKYWEKGMEHPDVLVAHLIEQTTTTITQEEYLS